MDVQDDEAAQAQVEFNRTAMKDCHAQPGGDGFFDRAIVAQFEAAFDSNSLPAEEFFCRETSAGAFFALNEYLMRQTSARDSPGPG